MEKLLRLTLCLILTGTLALSAGCARQETRVVIVNPKSEDVQLAEDIEAHVYVETKDGRVKSTKKTKLYEGQWVVIDPGE